MARPKVVGRDMPPQKRACGVIINEEAVASWAKAKKLPPKRGKCKGKVPVIVTPAEESSDSEGVYETHLTISNSEGDSQDDSLFSISEPEDDTLLQARRAELRSKAMHGLSRILEPLMPTLLAPAPPVQGPPPWSLN
uniref:Integrase core domain containing protein n=1 Tax=Solanum tuberosum TaxID=4113 RepID=M1DZW3_SOLTU